MIEEFSKEQPENKQFVTPILNTSFQGEIGTKMCSSDKTMVFLISQYLQLNEEKMPFPETYIQCPATEIWEEIQDNLD